MSSAEENATSSSSSNDAERHIQGEEMWTHDMFGCFSDWRLCIASFCCPCYTAARNAQYFGEDCMTIGLLYLLGCGFGLGPVMRWRARGKKNIRGSMVSDVFAHYLCPCCAIIQENKELYGLEGSHIGEKMPLNVQITRE